MKHALFKTVSNDNILSSFLNYITSKETSMVYNFSNGADINPQVFIDILSESRVFEQPTKDNILELCTKAGRVALIRLPSLSMSEIVSGMGNFWKNITPEMLDSINAKTQPTPEHIINLLNIAESNQSEQKITTWLHRFIRSADKDILHQLARFITGSENLVPDELIKVEFTDQSVDHIRPIAETCFKILRLPRQYQSFSHLNDNLIYYLSHEELWAVSDTPIINI